MHISRTVPVLSLYSFRTVPVQSPYRACISSAIEHSFLPLFIHSKISVVAARINRINTCSDIDLDKYSEEVLTLEVWIFSSGGPP